MLLQTYIEYLRGLVEQSKTINHHGKETNVESIVDLADENYVDRGFTNKMILNVKPWVWYYEGKIIFTLFFSQGKCW